MPIKKAKTKAGTQKQVHEEAKKLKKKKSHKHLTWEELHGVATKIVTGRGPKKRRKKK